MFNQEMGACVYSLLPVSVVSACLPESGAAARFGVCCLTPETRVASCLPFFPGDSKGRNYSCLDVLDLLVERGNQLHVPLGI